MRAATRTDAGYHFAYPGCKINTYARLSTKINFIIQRPCDQLFSTVLIVM